MFIILLSSTAFAAIVTSGDAGESWAQETAAEKCRGENVEAVFICLGNVVKVVSTVPGAGSTFYEPDGNVAECPVVSASEMGAECVQMTMPNYCPTEVVCGEGEEQVFPGHYEYDEEVEEAEEEMEEVEAEPEEEVPEVVPIASEEPEEEEEPESTYVPKPSTKPSPEESVFESLAFVMLALGFVAVVVLYILFRRTIGR